MAGGAQGPGARARADQRSAQRGAPAARGRGVHRGRARAGRHRLSGPPQWRTRPLVWHAGPCLILGYQGRAGAGWHITSWAASLERPLHGPKSASETPAWALGAASVTA